MQDLEDPGGHQFSERIATIDEQPCPGRGRLGDSLQGSLTNLRVATVESAHSNRKDPRVRLKWKRIHDRGLTPCHIGFEGWKPMATR